MWSRSGPPAARATCARHTSTPRAPAANSAGSLPSHCALAWKTRSLGSATSSPLQRCPPVLKQGAQVNPSLVLILVAILCGVAGQITLKMGMTAVGEIGGDAPMQPPHLALRVLTTPLVMVGLGLYVLGAMAWMTVLSRVALSFAYPMLALTYAIT